MKWLSEAEKHKLVVGSEARILYSDQVGRVKIALAFNEAVAKGRLKVRPFFSLYSIIVKVDDNGLWPLKNRFEIHFPRLEGQHAN